MAIGKLPDEDGGGDEGSEAIFAEINITPLTDVFLVMVIIFMVSALAVQVEARREKHKVKDADDADDKADTKDKAKRTKGDDDGDREAA